MNCEIYPFSIIPVNSYQYGIFSYDTYSSSTAEISGRLFNVTGYSTPNLAGNITLQVYVYCLFSKHTKVIAYWI